MTQVQVRFERGRDDVVGPVLGPYPWVQVTYNMLRAGPEGEEIAMLEPYLDDWFLIEQGKRQDEPWSDFVIAPFDPKKEVSA